MGLLIVLRALEVIGAVTLLVGTYVLVGGVRYVHARRLAEQDGPPWHHSLLRDSRAAHRQN